MKNDFNKSPFHPFDSAHKPFSYIADDVERAGLTEFVELTLDISGGIATCLELISSSDIARDCGELPTIGPTASASLLRLAMAASKLLQEDALQSVSFLNDCKRIKGNGS